MAKILLKMLKLKIESSLYIYFNNIDDFFVEKIHLKYRLALHYLGNENC